MSYNLKNIIKFLNTKNIDAWISGGTARDIYLNREFTTVDISVKASLSEIREIFSERIIQLNQHNNSIVISYLNNEYILYPLQTVVLENTYPIYKPTESLEEDAQSRDFTINSLYYNPLTDAWLDYFGGKADADNKKIKFIGSWDRKILESKIRLLRASVLVGVLGDGWEIDYHSSRGISNYSLKIAAASRKSINNELRKIFTRCQKPSLVFDSLKNTDVLQILFPEIMYCIGLDQSAKTAHYLDLYQHTMFALDSVNPTNENRELIRVAALLHDIAKPHTETITERGRHFYNHEVVGKELAEQILYRWGYPASFRKKVGLLIFHHLFNIKASDSKTAIKKFVARVGPDLIHSVLDLRVADINGVPQSKSLYQINNLRRKVNEVLAAVSPENAKLALSDDEIENILVNYTEPNLLQESIKNSKKYLLSKIFLGRVYNKKPNLKKQLKQTLEITCPLDIPHLLSTWENIQKGDADTFKDGRLKCGVYCGFNCDKKLSK